MTDPATARKWRDTLLAWSEKVRFNVGLRIAYLSWSIGEAFTAVGNWAEDKATARHPLSFKTHWRQRNMPNGWNR